MRLGMTQAQLSRELGCRQQTISEWEQGLYEPANAYGKLLTIMERTAPPLQEGANFSGRDHLSKSQNVDKSESITNLTQTALDNFDSHFAGANPDTKPIDPEIE